MDTDAYLENRLRELVPFPEVPFVVEFVTRSRKSVHELRTTGRHAEHDAAKKLDEFLSEDSIWGTRFRQVETKTREMTREDCYAAPQLQKPTQIQSVDPH